MKFGLALLRQDGNGQDAGVVELLSEYGIKINSVLGVGTGSLTAMLLSMGLTPFSTAYLAEKAFGHLQLYKRAKARIEITNEIKKRGVARLDGLHYPVYLYISDKSKNTTVITADKLLLTDKIRKCELSTVAAADYLLRNGRNRVSEEISFRYPLGLCNSDGILSVSGCERKSGITDYGYNISLRKGMSFKAVYNETKNQSDEMLKALYLR